MDTRNMLKNLMQVRSGVYPARKLGNEMGRQIGGIRGLMTTNYSTPRVTTPQDRRQNMYRNLLVGRKPV